MKTNCTQILLLFALNITLVACSKTETSDMMFKQAVSEQSLVSPVPGGSNNSMPAPTVIEENNESPAPAPVVVVTNPVPAPPVVVVEAPPVVVPAPPVVVVEAPPVVVPAPPVVVVEAPPVVAPAPPVVVVEAPPVVVPAPPVVVVEAPPVVVPAPPVVVVEAPPVVVPAPPVVVVEAPADIIYPESEIPVCKFDLTLRGLGSASKVVIASAPKADLMGPAMKGFEALSNSELSAMKNAVDSAASAGNVLVLKENENFDKQFYKNSSLVRLVIHSKPGKVVDIGGLGADAQIYVMIVSQEHNTLCVRTNGNSSMGELSITSQTTPDFAARASVNINGNGSINSYMKVIGGHRSGSSYEGQSISNSNLTIITEGKYDTFSSIKGNGVSNSEFMIKIKGQDSTGYGMSANFINDSKMHMEIEGKDGVRAMMNVKGKMEGNEVSGWLKAKSGAKVDSSIENFIEIMPLP